MSKHSIYVVNSQYSYLCLKKTSRLEQKSRKIKHGVKVTQSHGVKVEQSRKVFHISTSLPLLPDWSYRFTNEIFKTNFINLLIK